MKLIKSIFWLSIAFVAVGPQVNAVESVGTLSQQAVDGSGSLLATQLGQVQCQSIECAGGKAVVAAGLELLPQSAAPALSAPIETSSDSAPVAPIPRPRLDRTG